MNDKIDDGGPAFPSGSVNRMVVGTSDPLFPGMTLRDWFAGMALQGILSDSITINSIRNATPQKDGPAFNQLLSEMAYETADAMLEARKK